MTRTNSPRVLEQRLHLRLRDAAIEPHANPPEVSALRRHQEVRRTTGRPCCGFVAGESLMGVLIKVLMSA
jgi:hypothetical protein